MPICCQHFTTLALHNPTGLVSKSRPLCLYLAIATQFLPTMATHAPPLYSKIDCLCMHVDGAEVRQGSLRGVAFLTVLKPCRTMENPNWRGETMVERESGGTRMYVPWLTTTRRARQLGSLTLCDCWM